MKSKGDLNTNKKWRRPKKNEDNLKKNEDNLKMKKKKET